MHIASCLFSTPPLPCPTTQGLPKSRTPLYTCIRRGAVAQLGERLLCTEEVRGSTPLSSTISPLATAFSIRL